MPASSSDPILSRFLSHLQESGALLDVGCGGGHDAEYLSKLGYDIVGIDTDTSALAEARLRAPECVFREMNMQQLKYPPYSFDGIRVRDLSNYINTENAHLIFNEFNRVLKPDGVISLNLTRGSNGAQDGLDKPSFIYEPSNLCRLLTDAGFEIIEEGVPQDDKTTSGLMASDALQVIGVKAKDSRSLTHSFESEPDCLLCPQSRFTMNRKFGLAGSSSILWGDNDLYVMPDIAPILEGHLLLTSTSHYICYGACPEALSGTISAAQQRIRSLFKSAYGEKTIFMEHGPAEPRRAGSCIDHAHWHCLPSSLPVKETVETFLGPGQHASLETLRQLYRDGVSYVYVEEDLDEGWVFPVNILPSQFLRQVVVNLLGHTQWEWQTSVKTPETQNIFRSMLNRLLILIDRQ